MIELGITDRKFSLQFYQSLSTAPLSKSKMTAYCTKCDIEMTETGKVEWEEEKSDCSCITWIGPDGLTHPGYQYRDGGRWVICPICDGEEYISHYTLIYQCPGCDINGVWTTHRAVTTDDKPKAHVRVRRHRHKRRMVSS